MNKYSLFYSSPLGWLRLSSDGTGLKSVEFVEKPDALNSEVLPEILSQTLVQLNEYFEGKRRHFQLNLNPEGSSFQKQVWQLVQRVNYGETKSYGDLAKDLGSLKFSRAVGMANGNNPIPIIIPCHRIIGNNGKLTGYSGGLEKKKWLLIHEQKQSGKLLL